MNFWFNDEIHSKGMLGRYQTHLHNLDNENIENVFLNFYIYDLVFHIFNLGKRTNEDFFVERKP